MIDAGRYTSGRIAIANLSAAIDSLELRRSEGAGFDDLVPLAKLLFARGDVLGLIKDHERAELVATEAIAISPASAHALYIRAQLAARFHRFEEANTVLDQALAAGYPGYEIDLERAALLQAVGQYADALSLRGQLAKRVSAMRRSELDRAEAIFIDLEAILPAHVPGRGHRAEVALARGQLDIAMTLIMPLLQTSDDPEYGAIYAEILSARGDGQAASVAKRAATDYELLLARRPEAYADHAAAFFMGVGKRPQRALELALVNRKLRDTPRSRALLTKAQYSAQQAFTMHSSICDTKHQG